jgi:hypothetical protein
VLLSSLMWMSLMETFFVLAVTFLRFFTSSPMSSFFSSALLIKPADKSEKRTLEPVRWERQDLPLLAGR